MLGEGTVQSDFRGRRYAVLDLKNPVRNVTP